MGGGEFEMGEEIEEERKCREIRRAKHWGEGKLSDKFIRELPRWQTVWARTVWAFQFEKFSMQTALWTWEESVRPRREKNTKICYRGIHRSDPEPNKGSLNANFALKNFALQSGRRFFSKKVNWFEHWQYYSAEYYLLFLGNLQKGRWAVKVLANVFWAGNG